MNNQNEFGLADRFFSKISPCKSNSAVLQETIEIDKLRISVVARLEKMEKDDDPFWWKDKEILQTFDCLYMAGIILLPFETVGRLRWIALVCIEICRIEEFSYGNMLLSVDYLPDENLDDFRDIYGGDVIDEILRFRREIRTKSWKSLI